MGWSRAAAAADDRRAGIDERGDVAREIVGAYREDRPPVYDRWQPCVRLHRNRQRGCGGEPFDELQHPVRAEAAVEADGVGVKSFEDCGDAVDELEVAGGLEEASRRAHV